MTNNISTFLQTTYGHGKSLTTNESFSFLTDAQIGIKFRVRENRAFRLSIGMPNLIDATYFYDINDRVTVNAGLKLCGPSVGLTLHPKISKNLLGHISFGIGGWIILNFYDYDEHLLPISASLGCGLELITNK